MTPTHRVHSSVLPRHLIQLVPPGGTLVPPAAIWVSAPCTKFTTSPCVTSATVGMFLATLESLRTSEASTHHWKDTRRPGLLGVDPCLETWGFGACSPEHPRVQADPAWRHVAIQTLRALRSNPSKAKQQFSPLRTQSTCNPSLQSLHPTCR